MRVAIYHPWIYLKGGIERTILELVQRSRHDWTIFTGRYMPDQTFDDFRDLDVRLTAPLSVTRKVLPVAKACFSLLTQKMDWSGFDAGLISCDGIGNLLTIRSQGAPLACLCFTPLRVAYDPETSARWRDLNQPGPVTRLGVGLFRYADRLTWRRYERVVCISEEVRKRLLDARLVTPERTEVNHLGVDLSRFVATGRRERFFLMPGRIMWTKNIELGIRAFIRMKDVAGAAVEDLRLVVAGVVDEKSRPYLAQLRAIAGERRDIEFVVDPDDRHYLDLHDRCLAVLFTPPNEDFGLVPIEAMAFGKPVVAVDRGGPRETVIDGETGYLRPPAEGPFAEAMATLATADAAALDAIAARARRRAETFAWQRFVLRMDDCLDEIAARRARPAVVAAAR